MSGHFIGLSLETVPTPALVLDMAVAEENMRVMQLYMDNAGTNLRPHTKTHKCPTLAHLQLKAGAKGICCATLEEAEAMAYAGVSDILIANEMVGLEKTRRVAALARHTDITVAVDDERNIEELSAAASFFSIAIGVLIDIDVGMGRCGVRLIERAVKLASKVCLSEGLRLRGVMGYEGHAVFIRDRLERERVGREANAHLVRAANAIKEAGMPVDVVSAGGTGTYDIAGAYPGVTEVQAGSYVFMDLTYRELDLPFKQALSVLTTVISNPESGIFIMDVGMKSISVERRMPEVSEHSSMEIVKLSEEHAKGVTKDNLPTVGVGDRLRLIPSHCCTTVNLYSEIYTVRDNIVEAVWPIVAKGKL